MNLREQVESLLPNWRSWYPSLFDAAVDLGILRARVCDPSELLLHRRHEGIRQQAAQAHREKWNAEGAPTAVARRGRRSASGCPR